MLASPPDAAPGCSRRLLLFTKPARAGRVKTRLIGDLTAGQAADLHAAFLGDLVERLREGCFDLRLAWSLEADEEVPAELPALPDLPGGAGLPVPPGVRQEGDDLGRRLFAALSAAAREAGAVAAVGSDHPTLPVERVQEAFERVEAGAKVVLGPAEDGGYYLIALAAGAVVPRLFEEIPWSTPGVLEATLARCRELGLATELLPAAPDVDTPEDLRRLARRLAAGEPGCPRTRALLAAWGRLEGKGTAKEGLVGEKAGEEKSGERPAR